MAEANLKIGASKRGNRIEAHVGRFQIGGRIHKNDWGVALLYWVPFALTLTVGPFTVDVGWRDWGKFYGPGFSYIKSGDVWYWAAFLSDKLWWESA